MPSRLFLAWIVLIGIQSAVADEHSLVVARKSSSGAIVAAPRAPEHSVFVASREVPLDMVAETTALLKQKERELERLQAEIKQLKAGLAANSQILICVEMLEVSRTKLRQMGTDFAIPSGAANAKVLKSMVDGWIEKRAAKRICEPNLIVTSGRPGSFHVGGEIPIQNSDDPKAAVGFQKFGTEVDALATATDDEHVRIELRIKVSEIDQTHYGEINGSKIPALKSRQCDTAVEAKFGEPVVLHGLTTTRTETVKASDGQMNDQDNEIMLLIIVTPELVEPITPREAESNKASRK